MTQQNVDEDVFRIAIKSRVYHADLLAAAQQFGSVKALAKYLGINESTLGNWVTLKSFPSLQTIRSDGRKKTNSKLAKKWPLIEKRLFEVTGKTVKQLFPDFVRLSGALEAPKETISVKEVSAGTMLNHQEKTPLAIPFYEQSVSREEVRGLIENVLTTLTWREREVLRLRFGLNGDNLEYSLRECGKILNVTANRVRQIEMKALRKMRSHNRPEKLQRALESIDFEKCPNCNLFVPEFRHCDKCLKVLCLECMAAHLRSEDHKQCHDTV